MPSHHADDLPSSPPSPASTPLRALLLDVDGTLAETERRGHLPAFNRAFAAAGLDWCWSAELYGDLLAITGGRERIRHYLRTYRPDVPLDDETEGLVARLHAEKNRLYAAAVAGGDVPLRPGVRRLLEEARAEGLRLAVVTTTSPENVATLIRHHLGDARDWFADIVAGDAVQARKPAPDAYLRALEDLRLRPAECLALEDSAAGLRAALAAGVPTLVTVSDFTADDDFSGAAAVVDGLGEPDAPMRILAGESGGGAFVDVSGLRRLHAGALQRRG